VKITLKKAAAILMIVISSLSFSEDDRTGFLSNMRELKEISDIMDIIQDSYVENANAQKIKEEKNKNTNQKNTGVTKKSLMQGALRGMMESLDDPHSVYFTREELRSFQEDIKGKYVGVGMVIQKKVGEPLTVVSPIEDGPAYKAGIKPKDQIVEIDGESTYNLTSEEASKRLKGKANTSVKVKVYREANKLTKVFELKRETIELKYVKSKMLEGGIGYLRLTQFGDNVYPDMKKALEGLQAKGMRALILDLRSNPGGELGQSIKIASMFIEKGKIVSTRQKKGEETVYSREGKYFGNFPMVVLINGGSASASEIFAAAMQDYNRAIIVGQQTFGKGTVQQSRSLNFVYDLDKDPLGYIQYTIQKFYRINGGSTQLKGVDADIKFPEIINAAKTGESFEDNALPWDKIPAASYQEAGHARDAVETLTQKHEERVAKNPEFIVVNEDIAIRKERDERKFMSLNLAERQKENKEDEERRLKNLNERFKREGKKPLKDIDALPKDYEAPDFYLKETEQMMVDWLEIDKKA